MGKINNFICQYLEIPRYNADFWNGTVFGGKRRVKIWQLERKDYDKVGGWKKKPNGGYRKVQMLCRGKKDTILAVKIVDTLDCGVLIQNMVCDTQEVKCRTKDRLASIRTVVLYCGEGAYEGASEILTMLERKGIVQECNVRICNLCELREENYESSFREIVGIFKRKDSKEELLAYYLENEARFRQMDEISIDVMGALIGMDRLRFWGQEKGGFNMCKAFADAIEEGREKGWREGSFYALCCLVKKGKLKVKDAASEVGMTEELFLESMKLALNIS